MISKAIPLTIAALSLVFTLAASSQAIELNKDGRKIDTHWKQKKSELRVWGVVEEGEDCKQLNVSIFLTNSKDANTAHVEASIRPYRSHTRNTFKATDTVYAKRKDRKKWHVNEIYTNCLN